jgi:hypothetical protein
MRRRGRQFDWQERRPAPEPGLAGLDLHDRGDLRISPTSLLAFATAHQIWRYHRLGEAGDHSWMRPASGPRDFAAFRGQIT